MKKLLITLIGIVLYAGSAYADGFYQEMERSFTALGSGGVYTSSMIEVGDYKTVNVNVLADEDSAENGLKINFYSRSSNGTPCGTLTYTANGTGWSYTSGNSPESYAASVRGECVQVTFTNGSNAQDSFYISIFATQ